jgi:hypothetical protein
VPDHISPRGMGGVWRDDHPDNIQAVHRSVSREPLPPAPCSRSRARSQRAHSLMI